MGKKRPPADPQQRFGDTSNVGSSTGWTDEKHMLYITSLEESFVNQLYSGDGEINSAKSFYRIPGVWQKTCSGNGRNAKYDQGQGYWGMVVADEAESRLSEVGYVGSPSCSGESPYYMADASSNGPRQERTSYHAGQMTSGGSAAFHLHQHGHSFYWRTESSDQNFFDGETEASREQGRGSSKNQRKHAGRPNWKRRSAIASSWFRRPHHPRGKLRNQWDGPCKLQVCKKNVIVDSEMIR